MISATYLIAAAILAGLAAMIAGGSLGLWGYMALLCAAFFVASAAASAGYLTVSETFPLEIRAMAIALFYAISTGIGGAGGPPLFGQLLGGGRPPRGARRRRVAAGPRGAAPARRGQFCGRAPPAAPPGSPSATGLRQA